MCGARMIHELVEHDVWSYPANTVKKPHLLPEEYQEWVERAGVQRGVCDYIAGMTDRYAQREYQQLFALFEPM